MDDFLFRFVAITAVNEKYLIRRRSDLLTNRLVFQCLTQGWLKPVLCVGRGNSGRID